MIEQTDLGELLRRVGHWLPAQGPIKDFIHHNTLHAFQDRPFREGVREGAKLYGANAYMPPTFYAEAYRSGQITPSALERALEEAFAGEADRVAARERLLSPASLAPASSSSAADPEPIPRLTLHAGWRARLDGRPLERLTHPPFFRLIGGYLDQGLSRWRMPGAERLDFYTAVGELISRSLLPSYPLRTRATSRDILALLKLPAEEALLETLRRVVGEGEFSAYYEPYLLELLLSQRGWAGLAGECERRPENLLSPRKIRLLDYAAVALLVEYGCLLHECGRAFQPLRPRCDPPAPASQEVRPEVPEAERDLEIWQDAFEWSYYEPLLGGIAHAASGKTGTEDGASVKTAPVRAFFCIDDRECSFRRHLEEITEDVETFATAGFFGLDFLYQGASDAAAGKHCPLPIQPKHLVIEEAPSPQLKPWIHGLFPSGVLSQTLHLGSALRLAASLFVPSVGEVYCSPLSSVSHEGRLRLVRDEDARSDKGLWLGYSIDELAERVRGVLQSSGAAGSWPELAVFFGHGSSSANNPYFAAYNCGACSGRSGAPNARAFAEAANLPEVRSLLKKNGMEIPDTTRFIGALHDTTRDEVTYYDLNILPPGFKERFESFRKSVDEALERNATERCRRFDNVPLGIDPRRGIEEAARRASSLFEPRPEYNHATNASCIVGRRNLTKGLFLDHRAFLNSYDPSGDPRGETLTGILKAVIPVCGGINLEYLFSRIDPWNYGAGSKLPHNVNGLLGVSNGVEGDLLTGLPTQMTEIHDPLRLIVVVEQTPEIALMAVRRDPGIFEWVRNQWVRYACVDTSAQGLLPGVWIYGDGGMKKVDGIEEPKKTWNVSLAAASGSRAHLPVGFIRR